MLKKKTYSMVFPAIFLCLLIFFSAIALSFIKKSTKKNIHQSLQTVLHITEEALIRWSTSQTIALTHILSDYRVKKLSIQITQSYNQNKRKTANVTHNLKQLRDIMKEKLGNHNAEDFFIIAKNRISIASMHDSNMYTKNIIDVKRKEHLNRAFNGEKLVIPTIIPNIVLQALSGKVRSHQPITFVAMPVKSLLGKVIAVFTLRLNPLHHFTSITEVGRMGNTGETYAFDKTGLLLTNSRFVKHLRQTGVVNSKELAMLRIRIADPGGNMLEGFKPSQSMKNRPLTLMASRAISGNTTAYLDSYRDYRGVPVLGAWLWNKKLGIGLTTEIDAEEALASYRYSKIVIVVIVIIIIALLLALVIVPLWFKEQETIALIDHQNELEAVVKQRTEELEKALGNLRVLSEIDPLTQVANRRLYERILSKEVAMAKRTSQPLSILIVDIDLFKQYNDNYGHAQGDVVLKTVAQVISYSLTRSTDFVARFGGEEFVILLPVTDVRGATQIANAIRQQIETQKIPHKFSNVIKYLTVSIGISSLKGDLLNEFDLFTQADEALYRAKEAGRNQVKVYE